jgi:hypothetical protein
MGDTRGARRLVYGIAVVTVVLLGVPVIAHMVMNR